jgi:acylphosphatase
MSRVACKVRVTGLVQGVFFRAWAAEQARASGVVGWIRNAPDGSVEAHLEGDKHAVQQLIDQLRQGPPAARVERVDVEPANPESGDRFEVRH